MRALLAGFGRDKDGAAAAEFAVLLPFLITLFFGVTEVTMALSCRADVANVASTAADLVAQESAVTPDDMTNVFSAASAILYPNAVSNAVITVYSIVDNNNSSGKVAWSCVKTGINAAITGPATPPTGSTGGDIIAATHLNAAGNPSYGGSGSVILTTIAYRYTSPTMQIITAPLTMQSVFYAKPRRVAQIAKPTSCS